jgi:TetR/AcrR family transcriptional regulator, transcriptional repressor of aconitase
MPRPRFEKLAPEKREHILEAAAREFAAQGFNNASLNHILAEAGISKGAAYYYFDGKADLFITAVSHYSQIMIGDLALELDALTAANFWPALAEQYRQQFLQAVDRPWMFGLFKAAGSLSPEPHHEDQLAIFSAEMQTLLQDLLAQGQALGLIRTDLPGDFLYALVLGVDEAHDRWLLPQWPQMGAGDVETAVTRILDLLQCLLSP